MPPGPYIPNEIHALLALGAKMVISVSGGKDSQSMTSVVRRALPNADTRLLFANLGAAEWPQTPGMVREFSRRFDAPLEIVQKRGRDGQPEDFIDFYEKKMRRYAVEKPGTPFWMSASTRDCTSGFKRGPSNAFFAHLDLVINAEGIRAEESAARAKRPPLAVRGSGTAEAFRNRSVAEAIDAWRAAPTTHRPAPRAHEPQTIPAREAGRHKPLLVIDWHPIHHWTEADVWEEIGHSLQELEERRAQYQAGRHEEALAGWTGHPCYVFGAARCSCVLCVLGDRRTLRTGMRENPDLAERYIDMEHESGYTLQQGHSLEDVRAAPEQGRLLLEVA